MRRTAGRHERTDNLPSTSGTPNWRAGRWPARVGILAMVTLGLAAPMVAALPASAPEVIEPEVLEATVAPAAEAVPGRAYGDREAFALLAAGAAGWAVQAQTELGDLEPAPTTTTTAAPATTTTAAPVTTTTAAPVTTSPPPPPTAPPAPAPAPAPAVPAGSVWDALAQCESGGNWSINTGNGYYGGLQFSASSWRAVGGTGLPHEHSRETQIAMGEKLKAAQGWGAWPSCSRKLGLR